MKIILSLAYLIFGLLIPNRFDHLKHILSKLLATTFIPIVIIYNVIFYNKDYLILMMFSLSCSFLLYILYSVSKKDSLKALCFSYSNIGWLGIPLAIGIFGEKASVIMISLYIGNSIFGNAFAKVALNPTKNVTPLKTIIGCLKAPPITAIFIAILLKVSNLISLIATNLLENLYLISKFGMTFSGMCVLGMWLRHAQYSKNDFIENLYTSLFKIFLGAIFVAMLKYLFLSYPIINSNLYIIFLIFLLPPAANIVALETAYRKTGFSVSYIGASTITSLIYILIYYIILKLYIL